MLSFTKLLKNSTKKLKAFFITYLKGQESQKEKMLQLRVTLRQVGEGDFFFLTHWGILFLYMRIDKNPRLSPHVFLCLASLRSMMPTELSAQ